MGYFLLNRNYLKNRRVAITLFMIRSVSIDFAHYPNGKVNRVNGEVYNWVDNDSAN